MTLTLTRMMKQECFKIKCKNCKGLHDLTKYRIKKGYFRCGCCDHFVFLNENVVYCGDKHD